MLSIQIGKYKLSLITSTSLITIPLLVIAGILFFKEISKTNQLSIEKDQLSAKLLAAEKDLEDLKKQDQYVINQDLKKEIDNIEKTYKTAVSSYESLLDLKNISKNTSTLDDLFAKSLSQLSERNYASAQAALSDLNKKISDENKKIASASAAAVPKNVSINNSPPSSGYQRQSVQTEVGTFLVDIISADLNNTKVIVDTASDSDCKDNCPVLSLGEYVSRSSAFAGVNGSYFCPASYPSCAGKTNSFDTLLMNKNKVYFNSDNNVYSTVPVAVFGSGWARFMGRSLDWGRDTSIDGVIANQPLLLSGGNIAFTGDGDPKKGSKGGRSFVGAKGSTVYIGVVHSATVAESAHALKTLGLENALNLDDGGSTALWYGGYKAGPGRNLPNAVLFVRR